MHLDFPGSLVLSGSGLGWLFILDSGGGGERTESERTVVISGGIRCKEPSRPHVFTIEF